MNGIRALAPRMIGRQGHLQALAAQLDAVATGPGRLVLIVGDAGVGKTRLMRSFVEQVQAHRGVDVLRGRCYDEQLAVPYGPFVDAIDGYLQAQGYAPGDERRTMLTQLLSELAADAAPQIGDPQAHKRRLFAAISRAVWPATPGERRLLVLEDLHWSDQTSQELLLFMARAAERARGLLIVASYRGDELTRQHPLSRLLADLARERLADELRVLPLERDELAAMVEATLERPVPPAFVHALLAHTEGNPFFVEETLQALIDGGRLNGLLEAAAQGQPLPPLAIPPSIKESILARTTDLDAATSEALRYAAVMGRRFAFEPLLRLSSLDEATLVRALAQLVARQLVVEERNADDRYSFRHALIREAVYDDMLGRERRMKHRAVLEVLSAQGDEVPVDQLAYHSLHARELAQARRYARLAGERAVRVGAYREALTHFEAVLELLDDAGRERAELLEAMAAAAYPLGDLSRLARYLRAAQQIYEQLGDTRRVADIDRRLGRVAWNNGDAQAAFAHTERAIGLLEAEPPSRELARAYSALSHLYMNDDQPAASVVWGERALALAEQVGDEEVKAHALNNVGSSLINLGQAQRGIAALEGSLALALEANLLVDAVRGYLNLSASLFGLGEIRRTIALLEAGLALADRSGIELYTDSLLGELAQARLELGDWQRAAELVEQAIANARMYHNQSCDFVPIKVELLLRQGRTAEARHLIDEMLPKAEQQSDRWVLGCLLFVHGLALFAEGNTTAAAEAVRRSLTLWHIHELPTKLKGLIAEAVEIYLAAGHQDEVTRLMAILEPHTDDEHQRVRGTVDEAYGLLAAYTGNQQVAAARFAQAATHYAVADAPYQEVRARRRVATSLLQLGETTQATKAVAAARAIAERLGAQGELAALAALNPPTSPRSSARRSELTRREQQVLALLVRGASNRAIADALVISEKTVEVHVSNILGKLGVASRAQAAAYAVEHSLTATLVP
jgi:predicted ATPase/DNA-binding CsgD family transcriptional regulator